MAKFALVDNDIITQVQVAEDIDSLGPLALIFEVVQVDGLEPEPSRGWTRANGVWFPPSTPEAAKELWNGSGFEVLEAPAEEEEEPSKKGK